MVAPANFLGPVAGWDFTDIALRKRTHQTAEFVRRDRSLDFRGPALEGISSAPTLY